MPSTNRRHLLRLLSPGSVCLVAGCTVLSGVAVGDLFVRVRNMTPTQQSLSVTGFVANEESPSIKDSTSLPAATGGNPPWPDQIWHRENVRATESYRINAVVDGQQYEHQDTANCINQNRAGDTEFSAHHELVDITIQPDEVKILSGDCPFQGESE